MKKSEIVERIYKSERESPRIHSGDESEHTLKNIIRYLKHFVKSKKRIFYKKYRINNYDQNV